MYTTQAGNASVTELRVETAPPRSFFPFVLYQYGKIRHFSAIAKVKFDYALFRLV
jgi:hypothetical protein